MGTCEFTHHFCKGSELADGCFEEDKCVPKQPCSAPACDEGVCPGTCPVECEAGWIKCDGTIDYYNKVGCKGQDICHIKAKDTNGQYCPDESDSHGCPKTCPEDEILCPPQEGQLGCKEEAKCSPRTACDDGTVCPDHSDCPTVCAPHHINCPGGVDDCGCKTADQCADKGTHQWGETPGAQCPGWCPAICNDHEVLCPSMIDPCNGCPTEEICREAIKDKNGVFCPGKEYTVLVEGEDYRENGNRRGGFLSASHNCPVYCKEWKGEIQCPVYEDVSGCKPEASCVERQVRSVNEDGTKDYCNAASVCPKQCPAGQKLCQYDETDPDGCGYED